MKKSPKVLRTTLALSLLMSLLAQPLFAMETPDTTAQQDNDLQDLEQRLAELKQNTPQNPSFYEKCSKTLQAGWDTTKAKTNEYAQIAKEYAAENPYKTAAITTGGALGLGYVFNKLFLNSYGRIFNRLVEELKEANAYTDTVKALVNNKEQSTKEKVLTLLKNDSIATSIGEEKIKKILGTERAKFIEDANKAGIVSKVASKIWDSKFKLGLLGSVAAYFVFPNHYKAAGLYFVDMGKNMWQFAKQHPLASLFTVSNIVTASNNLLGTAKVAGSKVKDTVANIFKKNEQKHQGPSLTQPAKQEAKKIQKSTSASLQETLITESIRAATAPCGKSTYKPVVPQNFSEGKHELVNQLNTVLQKIVGQGGSQLLVDVQNLRNLSKQILSEEE